MSYCHEKGLFCEFARASGYCTSTGCNKLTTVTYEIRTMTPATNADHIRSMTDEELAKFLWVETDRTFNYCDVCEHYRTSAPHCAVRSMGRECIKARVNWLKQPYKEDT